MHVTLIAKPTSGVTGTSRYTQNLFEGLRRAGIDVRLAFPGLMTVWPPVENVFHHLGMDMKAFFDSYPIKIKPGVADIFHLTTQTFASLLMTSHFNAPVVVTVLDIIPYLLRRNPELNTFRHPLDYALYRLSLMGLKRASVLIAISEYTKFTLVKALGLPGDRIHVIYPFIDQFVFRPQIVPDAFLEKYGLSRGMRHILYVGTNDPRKNLGTLVQAFGLLKQKCNGIKLLKVGSDPFAQERQRLDSLIAQSGLKEDILFLENVTDEDLAYFYNFSDLFVFPSFFEGFGLPVVEAMSCGTPVICSSTTSLLEVASEAARFIDPRSIKALATSMEGTLEDSSLRERLRVKGFEQAAKFVDSNAIDQIRDIYERLVV